MRKRPFTCLLMLLCAYSSMTQLPCGFSPFYEQLQQEIPDLGHRHHAFIRQVLDANQANYRDNEIYKIPVVVHVVWRQEEENLSEERIRSQIEVLNQDFRLNNEDHDQLRPEFSEVAGDGKIEFELVDIIRVQTDSIFAVETDFENQKIQYPEGIKQKQRGGSDAWDPNYFLNIWVAAIADDLIFGYSYPPSGLLNWPENSGAPAYPYDGIVINYKAFGATPPPYETRGGEIITLKGRTLVHELGHYLGLLHPWGNFEIDQDGCFFDDGIDDTPMIANSSFYDCDLSKNSCHAQLEDLPDMVENFMDYSSDECRICFTKQQVQVMRSTLQNERKDLRVLEKAERFAPEIIVYPNPTVGNVRVYLRKEIKKEYRFRLRSLDREIIPVEQSQNIAFPGISFSFEMGHLDNGIYLIELETDQWRFVKKIVLLK